MIEEQLIKSVINMGEIGLFVAGCIIAVKYFIDEKKTNAKKHEDTQKALIEQIKKNDEQRVATYREMLNELREDNKKREDAHLSTINKFSDVLAENNKALTELSVQIENLGGRMADIEHSMDKVNEKLGFETTV